MNISPIKHGDLVRCNVRGEKFFAEVIQNQDGNLTLEPINRTFLPAYNVQARQVIAHYRKSKASK